MTDSQWYGREQQRNNSRGITSRISVPKQNRVNVISNQFLFNLRPFCRNKLEFTIDY